MLAETLLSVLIAASAVTGWAAESPESLSTAEEKAIQAAVAAVSDSIVQVHTIGGLERVERVLTSTAPTSGVIVSEDGYIICSSFSFVQQPTAVLVTLASGQEYAAKLVAKDRSRRLVLLKIKPKDKLVVPSTVDREELQVGQWAIAIGKSFDIRAANVSVGIVSATNRIWSRAVQTDAKISPANYGGALIDIYGKVIGVLVPLSTEDSSQLAGAEMYDSGIGFAVPLTEIQSRLDDMIAGKELMPGLLGVTLKTKDLYQGELQVASTAPKSPARIAGILPGDTILKIADKPVESQSELKHAIGPLYGGDEISIALIRNGKKETVQVTLADRIVPYVHPFFGVLPERDRDRLTIRYVYPDSPAAKAGLEAGDQLNEMNGERLDTATEWRDAIAALEPDQSVTIKVDHDGKTVETKAELASIPEAVPEQMPATEEKSDEADLVRLKLPAEANDCLAIVPKSYDAEKSYGLLVWLGPPNFESEQKLVERWSSLTNERQLIVLAPQPINNDRWLPAETAVIRKYMDRAMTQYSIDPERVVLHGYQAGGSLAHRVALTNRDIVRAVAVVDATTPRGVEFRSNDPIERLAYYLVQCKDSKYQSLMERDTKGFRALKFPVTESSIDGELRYLQNDEINELARWIDALDRI